MQWELWKVVKGFEGFYEVSNFGRVRSIRAIRKHGGYRPRMWGGKVLKPKGKRYLSLNLWRDDGTFWDVRVHVLVALHFVPNPGNLSEVRHLDDNRKNNHVSNLCWGTRADNMKDKMINGKAGKKLTAGIVTAIRAELALLPKGKRKVGNGVFCERLAEKYGIARGTLYSIRRGKLWPHVT